MTLAERGTRIESEQQAFAEVLEKFVPRCRRCSTGLINIWFNGRDGCVVLGEAPTIHPNSYFFDLFDNNKRARLVWDKMQSKLSFYEKPYQKARFGRNVRLTTWGESRFINFLSECVEHYGNLMEDRQKPPADLSFDIGTRMATLPERAFSPR